MIGGPGRRVRRVELPCVRSYRHHLLAKDWHAHPSSLKMVSIFPNVSSYQPCGAGRTLIWVPRPTRRCTISSAAPSSEKAVRLAQKMVGGPCITVGIQLQKAEVGPTSGPTWRLSHFRAGALAVPRAAAVHRLVQLPAPDPREAVAVRGVERPLEPAWPSGHRDIQSRLIVPHQ